MLVCTEAYSVPYIRVKLKLYLSECYGNIEEFCNLYKSIVLDISTGRSPQIHSIWCLFLNFVQSLNQKSLLVEETFWKTQFHQGARKPYITWGLLIAEWLCEVWILCLPQHCANCLPWQVFWLKVLGKSKLWWHLHSPWSFPIVLTVGPISSSYSFRQLL